MTRGMRKSHFLMFRLRGLSPDSSGWPLRQDNLAESEWRRRDPRLVGAFHGLYLTHEACALPQLVREVGYAPGHFIFCAILAERITQNNFGGGIFFNPCRDRREISCQILALNRLQALGNDPQGV